jgi:hypothetical protein
MMLPRMLAVGTKEGLCPESLEYLDRVDGLTGRARRPMLRGVVRLIHAGEYRAETLKCHLIFSFDEA